MSQADDKFNADQEAAYLAWLALRNKMDEDRTPESARAAGLAYGRFFGLYTENTYRPSSKVIPFPRCAGDAA